MDSSVLGKGPVVTSSCDHSVISFVLQNGQDISELVTAS
jgi:hypothetical protein